MEAVDPPGLGIHVMRGEVLLYLLRRVQEGELADDVYMEMYANAAHIKKLGEEDDE